MRIHRTLWGFDPAWLRCEAFDDKGRSLDFVWFEPHEPSVTPLRRENRTDTFLRMRSFVDDVLAMLVDAPCGL